MAGVDVARVVGAGSGVDTRGGVTAGLVVRMFAEMDLLLLSWEGSVAAQRANAARLAVLAFYRGAHHRGSDDAAILECE